MATGAGWQQYYNPAGKYSASGSGLSMEYTQDLHLKMSKKIAQLTKTLPSISLNRSDNRTSSNLSSFICRSCDVRFSFRAPRNAFYKSLKLYSSAKPCSSERSQPSSDDGAV
ncbi:protein FAM184A isoform X1 [Tachysurus ichikawai]